MLNSVITRVLIPLLFFICFLRRQTKAENELDLSLGPSTPLAISEIEDLKDQNLTWTCARLKAFQDAEKIFNSTDDSIEANATREEYHSRIKRCTEKEKQDRIIRQFERKTQKQEMREGKSRETNHKNNIRKMTINESVAQKSNNQITNEDSTLMGDLYQTMLHSESTEPHSRKYRTLSVGLNPLLSTSVSQNSKLASTEPSSLTHTAQKISEIFKDDRRNSFSREPEVDENLPLSTAPYTIPRIKAKQHENNPELSPTKVAENDRKRRKGLLRTLLSQVREIMEGGTLKNSVDLDESDLDGKSSSTDLDAESIEYETVPAQKFFDHSTTSSRISSSSGTSHDQQENLIIEKIPEDTKKQVQFKIEELEELRKEMAEILRQIQSTKNQNKVSPSAFDTTSVKHETTSGKNFKKLDNTMDLQNTDLSKNQNQKGAPLQIKSENGKNSDHHPHLVQKFFSIKQRENFPKFSSTPSMINILHTQPEKSQKPFHQFESSSDEPTLHQSSHFTKNKPGELFQTPSTKVPSLSRHGLFSEEPVAYSNKRSTSQTSELELLTTKTHPSDHPTPMPKSTTQLLLDKITQLTPFYKVEEWKKIITSGKYYLNEKSNQQPIRSNAEISPENISSDKSHVSSSIHPLVIQHSHHTDSSSTSKPPHSPLKAITPQKSSPFRRSHLNIKHSVENFTPHTTQSTEVTPPMKPHAQTYSVHQPNHHLFHWTKIPAKRIILKTVQTGRSSAPHFVHSSEFKSDENFTPPTHHSNKTPLPIKLHTENHSVYQSNHHHPSHPTMTSLNKITAKKARKESSSTTHSGHSPKIKSDENITPRTHQFNKVTLPIKLYTANHPVHQPNHHHLPHITVMHSKKITPEKAQEFNEVTLPMKPYTESYRTHHHELLKFDKISTLQPSHSTESFPKKIKLLEKPQDGSSSSHSVHFHSKSKHMDEISTLHPPSPTETYTKGSTWPFKFHLKNKAIPLHFEKTSTLLPSYSTNSLSKEIHLSQNSHKIIRATPSSHSKTTYTENIDAALPNILEEIKRLEKEKLEEFKNLQKQEIKILHKNHHHHPFSSNSELISEQKTSKYPFIDSTPSHKEDHSRKNIAEGRSGSEKNKKPHHTLHIPKPTHFTTSTTSPNDEMVDMPLPPLNPNDNWIYLKKLDEWYVKQNAKSSTPEPPTQAWTTAPSHSRTAPNQRPNSTITPTSTENPPPPINYHINSTIHRTYNITINMVSPDSAPVEDEERNEDEDIYIPPLDLQNEEANMVRSTGQPKITNEPTRDFDSLPHPSLPQKLSSQSTHLSDSPLKDKTTPLPSSLKISNSIRKSVSHFQIKISPNTSPTSDSSETNKHPRSSIHSDSKRPRHLTNITTLHKKILDKLKNPRTKFITSTQTTLTTDGKAKQAAVSHPHTLVGNCTPICNNYIIIIPNKTEEVIQIISKNDQTPLLDPPTTLQAPRSAQNDQTSDSNSSSDIKSLLEPIINAKMTPSNNTDLRKSINELMTSLKQRRFNEYSKLYKYNLNPMVGEGRNTIVAITQINEYIELLELMLVYLARDPDKLLDEKKDARVDNFESPYDEDDPQRRLIEDQFHYVHPKILNEFIDVYKKYSKDESYYGRPVWQFSQENDLRESRPRTSGGFLSNLFDLKKFVPLIYNRAPIDGADIQYY